MIALMILTVIAILIATMGVLKGDIVQQTEELLGRGPQPKKLHPYPYFKLITQVLLYALIFFLPGFLVTSAIYPKLAFPERFVLSVAFGALMYSFNVNFWIMSGKMIPWAMSQIFWDLSYMVSVSLIGFIAWRIRLSKLT